MLRIVIIVVFVLLGVCQDVLTDSTSCRVPDIQNGDFGRYVSSFDFEKVDKEEMIRDEEILTLRCNKGYAPFPRQSNNSKNGFFEVEITCEDGTWSKLLLCHSSRCGNPPRINYGYPTAGSRTHQGKIHGAVVTYVCRDRTLVEKGKVVCHFGEWIGEPPECMDNCNTSDLKDYDGFEIPGNVIYNHSKTLDIYCLRGYAASRPRLFITCQNGKWEVPNDLCIQSNRHFIPDSCLIPDVENGEIGQFQTRYADRRHEEFKKFTLGQRVNRNETFYLHCQNGFFPGDNSVIYFTNRLEIRCNGGVWSKLLQCKAAPCLGEPPKIDNGYPVIDNREHGYIVSYMCDNNNRAVKSDVECHFGSWIGNAPKCLEARCYTNNLDVYRGLQLPGEEFMSHLESFRVECTEDYKVTISGGTITCLNGNWIVPENPCSENFCYVPDVEYGDMGHFEKRIISRWSTIIEFKKFLAGSQVNPNETLLLSCDEDFLPTDDSEIFENNQLEVTCIDGTWSTNFSCKQMSCLEDPPPIRNGKPHITSREHGQTIWYECDSRIYTKVPGVVSCHFGDWIGYPPKCLNSPCSTKELNFPGLLKPTEEQLSSTESFDIICEIGFSKSSFSKKVTCIEGKWDITENPCTENPCNTNDLNYPGLEKPFGVFLGALESFDITCKRGFRKSSAKKKITCVKGKWDILEDPCSEEITCHLLSADNGLSVSYSNYNKIGSLATFSCPKNKKVSGATQSFCQDDGIWSSPKPYCQDYVPCSRLPTSPDLVISYSKGVSVGSNASFSCVFPYALVGSSYAICQNNGHWSHSLPKCEDLFPERRCSIDDLRTSVLQGVVPDMTGANVKFTPIGTEISLECKNNLIPNGNSKAECKVKGIWEIGIFQCVPGCKLKIDASSHLIIKPLKDNYRLGEFISLSCPPREILTNNVARLMCLDGTWSDAIPDCIRSK